MPSEPKMSATSRPSRQRPPDIPGNPSKKQVSASCGQRASTPRLAVSWPAKPCYPAGLPSRIPV
jgi:hypothetical protein